MIIHCNMKLKNEDILFLEDNESYYNRRLYFAVCPVCNKLLAKLVQTRILDSELVYGKLERHEKARKLIEKCLLETMYKSSDIIKNDGITYGLCYGDYTENKKNGKIVGYTEKAKDFYNSSKVLKKEVY